MNGRAIDIGIELKTIKNDRISCNLSVTKELWPMTFFMLLYNC
jgi:hypothetical protein